MTGAEIAGLVLLWYSLVAAVLVVLWLRRPKPEPSRKPLDRDALEATDAALRNRIVDLEDKFESYVKREAVRGMRARREAVPDDAAQGVLPLDRAARLSALRQRAAQQGLIRTKGA